MSVSPLYGLWFHHLQFLVCDVPSSMSCPHGFFFLLFSMSPILFDVEARLSGKISLSISNIQ
uniref:Uncharacterized protein n=1 Tax=Anguilla anguilla TaxID=7936 RepID=A0A0E9T7Y8_ANGAN